MHHGQQVREAHDAQANATGRLRHVVDLGQRVAVDLDHVVEEAGRRVQRHVRAKHHRKETTSQAFGKYSDTTDDGRVLADPKWSQELTRSIACLVETRTAIDPNILPSREPGEITDQVQHRSDHVFGLHSSI